MKPNYQIGDKVRLKRNISVKKHAESLFGNMFEPHLDTVEELIKHTGVILDMNVTSNPEYKRPLVRFVEYETSFYVYASHLVNLSR